MDIYIMNALYSIVTLLYGSIFTLLFLDIKLRDRRTLVSFSLFSVLVLGIQSIVGYYVSVDMVVRLYPLIVHVPLFLMCILYYGKSILTTCSSIMLCYFLTSPRYILAELVTLIFPMLPFPGAMGKIIASILLVGPIYKWMVPIVRRSFKRASKEVMHFFIPLILVYMFSYLLYVYTDLLATNGVVMMETVFTLFFLIVLYYMQKYFVSIDDIVEKENRNHVLAFSAEALKKQLDILNEKNEKTRILRHDMRHYATMVKRYAQIGDMERVVQISEELELKNNEVMVKNYCSNPWINVLLNNYVSQLEEAGVRPVMEISVPVDISIQAMDLCVVLGNILDNALRSIHACKGQRMFSILLRYDLGKLYLEIQNSCEARVSFQEGIPVSTREGHGFGSKSIVYITERYHGIYSFELQDMIFTTQIILHEK